jgi:alanyl-tRNA synthetase
MVTKDLVPRMPADKLLREIAGLLGGKGGGRPDMAQGKGTNSAGVPAALEAARKWVEAHA